MGGSKRNKRVKQKETPKDHFVAQREDPQQYYDKSPSWNFNNCDNEQWAFTQESVGDSFWTEILPNLQAWETQTWSEILVTHKKFNHGIDVNRLNKIAQDRLAERYIEAESIISLRLTGKIRIYGYMVGSVFNLLWYDCNHGDNTTCVCRSHKKHT